MTYNSHTWELSFEDEPLFIDGCFVGRFDGVANMARAECESITLNTDDGSGRYLLITPNHMLFRPLWASIRHTQSHLIRINNWREEVAA